MLEPVAEHARLYASTAFMYRPVPRVLEALKESFFGKARFLLHDQLYFAYALAKSRCALAVIEDNYLDCAYLTFTRGRRG
jgi:hypothetical protein